MKSPLRAASGFTLIEMLVVLAIIAALSIAGAMSMDRKPAAVRGAADTLYSALTEARALSRSTGRPVALATSGVGASLRFDYAPATFDATGSLTGIEPAGTRGQYSYQGDVGPFVRYVQIDDGGDRLAVLTITPTLVDALADANANNPAAFKYQAPAATWTNPLFAASGTPQVKFMFSPEGLPNLPFYAGVVGVVDGKPSSKAPLAIIAVDAQGIITRYYKERADDPSKPWKRL
jgi:prepilin-type N-terminal cleavage/methylation domain-containing protein